MPVNKFGHSADTKQKPRQLLQSQSTFIRTEDGDYDFENKKLCNLKSPTSAKDAVNKIYVDQYVEDLKVLFKSVMVYAKTLDKRIGDINTFISRDTPLAAKHMSTKKYVDDAIVLVKQHLRSNIKQADDELNKNIQATLSDLLGRFNILETEYKSFIVKNNPQPTPNSKIK